MSFNSAFGSVRVTITLGGGWIIRMLEDKDWSWKCSDGERKGSRKYVLTWRKIKTLTMGSMSAEGSGFQGWCFSKANRSRWLWKSPSPPISLQQRMLRPPGDWMEFSLDLKRIQMIPWIAVHSCSEVVQEPCVRTIWYYYSKCSWLIPGKVNWLRNFGQWNLKNWIFKESLRKFLGTKVRKFLS